MTAVKRQKLIKNVENHLRTVARKLIKFDTEEETLKFLIDSFRSQFPCDFAGIMIYEEDKLVAKVTSGEVVAFTDSMPLIVHDSTNPLFYKALTYDEMLVETSDCAFTALLKKEEMKTWFSVPLIEEVNSYGFCIIGFKNNIPLYKEMDNVFSEFGKDVATAIKLAKKKEAEKRKIYGTKWISKNLSLHSPKEKVVESIVERAGKGTDSRNACIYLYNEENNSFHYQGPSFGDMEGIEIIHLQNNVLLDYFPFLEKSGGTEITIPLTVDLKTVGVLHVQGKRSGVYSTDDLELLELLANHFASVLENSRLYNNVKNHKKKLHSLLEFQQSLVMETVKDNSLKGITKLVSSYFSSNVLLFDRFMRPLTQYLLENEEDRFAELIEKATYKIAGTQQDSWLRIASGTDTKIDVFPINDGRDLSGYLALEKIGGTMDDFNQLGIDLALNVYASQFAKQKLVIDAKEQVKDSFINRLLVKKILEPESVIQYANLFKWNLFDAHRVAVFSIITPENEENILEKEAQKSILWDRLKKRITMYDPDVQVTSKKDDYIVIVPSAKEMKKPKSFWSSFYNRVAKWLQEDSREAILYMGVGGNTNKLEDYYSSYQQARQTLNVVKNRFREKSFALFDEMGSYALLREMKDSSLTTLFLEKYIEPLLKYSAEKNADLFHTLRTFLHNHGNLSKTANSLYIHRSSLLYRMEKIESLLEIKLDDPDHRFNLMLAYRLYDLFHDEN